MNIQSLLFYKRNLLNAVSKLAIVVMSIITLVACSSESGTSTATTADSSADVAACMTASEDFVTANLGNANISDGGLAYDKWWIAFREQEPLDDHPLWATQSTNTRTGVDTWRCKECHGWDYMGMNGAYNSTSSHFTGFAGVFNAKADEPTRVFCMIRSLEDHSFTDVMSDQDILDLTAFIVDTTGTGTIDYYNQLDVNNMSTGNGNIAGTGNDAFTGAGGCATSFCHGENGTTNTGNEFSLGDLAVDNPFEFMHKIRYGHPGSSPTMPAGAENNRLSIQMVTDITAYAQQQLPTPGGDSGSGGGSGIEGDLVRGGLLYDNWPSLLTAEGAQVVLPTATMPLFALREDLIGNTRSGIGTWRCKECHGWDYEGAAGVYSAGSHFTGFPGVLDARNSVETTESYLFNLLKNGYTVGGVTYHKFMPYMTDTDISALVTFIKSGVLDTSRFISSFPAGGGKGDIANGQALYSFNRFDQTASVGCNLCHDNDGQGINFGSALAPEYLGSLARGNPWETLHKIRFGQPSTIGTGPTLEMPSALGVGFTNVDSADIMTYTQTLP